MKALIKAIKNIFPQNFYRYLYNPILVRLSLIKFCSVLLKNRKSNKPCPYGINEVKTEDVYGINK